MHYKESALTSYPNHLKMDLSVMHISTVHPTDDTRIYLKECLGLKDQGIKVTFVTQGNSKPEKDGIIHLNLKKRKSRLTRATLGVFQAFIIARRSKADIYHLHDPELIIAGILLCILGRKVVYDMHENVPAQITNKIWINRHLRAIISKSFRLLEKLSFPFFSVIFAENSYEKDYKWVKHTRTILNLPDIKRFDSLKSKTKAKTISIGYIGGVTNTRGIDITLSAIKKLRNEFIGIKFICIGKISDEVLKNPLLQQGISEDWIIAPGRKPPEEGWAKIAPCHIGIAILKPLANFKESYPTKLFEYMAIGLPIITSHFDLYKNVVEKHDCGICVDPESVDEVGKAIKYLAMNPKRATEMGSNGYQAASIYFDWNTQLKMLTEFYTEVVKHQ